MQGIDVLFFYEYGVMIAQCKNYDLGCQGNDIKECRRNLSALIAVEMQNRNKTLEGIPVAPNKFYSILAPVDFDYIEEIEGVTYSFNCSVIPNPNIPLGTKDNDNPDDYKLIRHPIFLSEGTVIVISTFSREDGTGLSSIFLSDYINYRKEQNIAMKDLVAQISDCMSVNAWWSLKEAIDEELNKHNEQFDTSFPLIRPKDQ